MKHQSKFVFLFFTLLLNSANLHAQLPDVYGNRMFFGGNFGVQFGNQTLVNINPLVGYRLTERLSAGVSVTYMYYRVEDQYHPTYSTNTYGGSIFARYFFLDNIFGHVEAEVLNLDVPDYIRQEYIRTDVYGFYVGGGYRQAMGPNSSMNILLLYNLNDDKYSPYQNPIIRIGFGFGI